MYGFVGGVIGFLWQLTLVGNNVFLQANLSSFLVEEEVID